MGSVWLITRKQAVIAQALVYCWFRWVLVDRYASYVIRNH